MASNEERALLYSRFLKMFPLPLSEVNALPAEAFENLFENVVEHAPHFAQQLANSRPFASVNKMIESLTNILMGLSDEGEGFDLYIYACKIKIRM